MANQLRLVNIVVLEHNYTHFLVCGYCGNTVVWSWQRPSYSFGSKLFYLDQRMDQRVDNMFCMWEHRSKNKGKFPSMVLYNNMASNYLHSGCYSKSHIPGMSSIADKNHSCWKSFLFYCYRYRATWRIQWVFQGMGRAASNSKVQAFLMAYTQARSKTILTWKLLLAVDMVL